MHDNKQKQPEIILNDMYNPNDGKLRSQKTEGFSSHTFTKEAIILRRSLSEQFLRIFEEII